MPRKKPGLTYDEHCHLGKRLNLIYNELVTLTTPLLGEKYRKDSRIANLSRKVTDDLSKLRCEMDDVLAEEHPGEPYQKVYYGHRE